MTFWGVFSKLCNEVGKKPNPVGKEIGVSSAAIANWKAGSIPNGETLMKIADYFHCSTDYLLGRTEEQTTDAGMIKIGHITGDNNIGNTGNVNVQTPPEELQSETYDSFTKKFMLVFNALDFDKQVNVVNYTMEQAKKGA